MSILLVDIISYFMLYYDYWWLFYYKLLLDILGYTIIGYWYLLYFKFLKKNHKLLLVILCYFTLVHYVLFRLF